MGFGKSFEYRDRRTKVMQRLLWIEINRHGRSGGKKALGGEREKKGGKGEKTVITSVSVEKLC